MRQTSIVGIALLAFVAGIIAAPLISVAADRTPEGHALKCIASGRVCVGMRAEQVLSSSSENNFGGLIGVYCGFDHPGGNVGADKNLAGVIKGGCSGNRYVAQFSDGRHLTSVWIDSGIVVQLDRVPRHALDL